MGALVGHCGLGTSLERKARPLFWLRPPFHDRWLAAARVLLHVQLAHRVEGGLAGDGDALAAHLAQKLAASL